MSLARLVSLQKESFSVWNVPHNLKASIPLNGINYSSKSPNVMIARSLVMLVEVFIIQVSGTGEIAQGLKGLKVR